jgi:hypothetical protein
MVLPLPPSRFIVTPIRIPRKQRKVDEKKERSTGPKLQESKEGCTLKK